jgi:hypothetical protein
MAESLTLQGRLEAFPELLKTMLANQGTASLRVERDGAEVRIWFQDGRIVHAEASDPDLALPDVLLARGELSLEGYYRVQEQLRRKRSLTEALAEGEALSPDEFLHALELQVQEILNLGCRWTGGRYTMVLEDALPPASASLRLNTERLVLNAVRQVTRFSLVKKGLGSFHRMLGQAPGQDNRLYRIELTEEETTVYNLFEPRRTIQESCGLSYLPNFETLRTVWALLVIRVLEEAGADLQAGKAEEVEFRLGAMVESYNNAFASVYAAVYQEIGEAIEEFLPEVVARVQPESRRFLEGSTMGEEGRLDYDILNHTMNRLRVPDRPQAILDLMNELLYAWVLQVRLRFGTKLQAVVDKAINDIREE